MFMYSCLHEAAVLHKSVFMYTPVYEMAHDQVVMVVNVLLTRPQHTSHYCVYQGTS